MKRTAQRRDGLTGFVCALVAALSLLSAWRYARLGSPTPFTSQKASS